MRTRLPPFSSVRAFEAAARHLSFKAAAEELHVSQSAISHQIHNLELFLHAPLFIRQPHGVMLNPLGESYLRQLTPLLDRLCACTEEVLGAGLTGPLRVQTTPAFAARWLVPRIGDFNEQYRDIELHISTSLEPPNFSRGDVDVVVQYGVEQADSLTVQPFLQSARSPVASPELLRDGLPIREPADLRHYTLLHDIVGDDWPKWFDLAAPCPIQLPRGPRFEHCNLTLGAAEQGQGIALGFLEIAESSLAKRHTRQIIRHPDYAESDLLGCVPNRLGMPRQGGGLPRLAHGPDDVADGGYRKWLGHAEWASTGCVNPCGLRATALSQF